MWHNREHSNAGSHARAYTCGSVAVCTVETQCNETRLERTLVLNVHLKRVILTKLEFILISTLGLETYFIPTEISQ